MTVKGNLYIISAPSGAGKSSLINAVLEAHPFQVCVSVSHTTRDPRPNEKDGVHYHFVNRDGFQSMIDKDDFLEYAQVFDKFYGTSKSFIDEQLNQGVDVFLDIDWQGARQVRETFPDSKSIFILPPSLKELEDRLNQRGQDSSDAIEKRMKEAQSESSHFDEYDYLIINDDFKLATLEISAILTANRCQTNYVSKANLDLIESLVN